MLTSPPEIPPDNAVATRSDRVAIVVLAMPVGPEEMPRRHFEAPEVPGLEDARLDLFTFSKSLRGLFLGRTAFTDAVLNPAKLFIQQAFQNKRQTTTQAI